MIARRESFAFDDSCKFCAQEKSASYVSEVNTRICQDCFSWVSSSVGLNHLGIEQLRVPQMKSGSPSGIHIVVARNWTKLKKASL